MAAEKHTMVAQNEKTTKLRMATSMLKALNLIAVWRCRSWMVTIINLVDRNPCRRIQERAPCNDAQCYQNFSHVVSLMPGTETAPAIMGMHSGCYGALVDTAPGHHFSAGNCLPQHRAVCSRKCAIGATIGYTITAPQTAKRYRAAGAVDNRLDRTGG